MATPPFAAELQAALKGNEQGGILYTATSNVVYPRFFCCISGNTVGVTKDPIARFRVWPEGGCSEPGDGSGTWFSCDVDLSYSATSTIASYEITWGDGAGTGPQVWPQGAPDTHQYTVGGVTGPIYYTITVTVTDMLGATSEETFQVAVIDCSVLPDIEAFAACGSSGLWYTMDGGRNWEERGATTFNGIPVNAIAVNWRTTSGIAGADNIEMMVATDNGVYRSFDSCNTSALLNMGLEIGEIPYALLYSWLGDAMYVLSEDVNNNRIRLHYSVDGGETWDALVIAVGGGIPTFSLHRAGDAGNWAIGTKIAAANHTYPLDVNAAGAGAWRESAPPQLSGNLAPNMAVTLPIIELDNGQVLPAGYWYRDNYPRTVGSAGMETYGSPLVGVWQFDLVWRADPYRDMTGMVSNMVVRTPVAMTAATLVWLQTGVIALPHADARHVFGPPLASWYEQVLVAFPGVISRGTLSMPPWPPGSAWVDEYIGPRTVYGGFGCDPFSMSKEIFAATQDTTLLRRDPATGTWAADDRICPDNINCITRNAYKGKFYVGTNTGVYRRDKYGYVKIYTIANVERIDVQFNQAVDPPYFKLWIMTSGGTAGVYISDPTLAPVYAPDCGRQFALAESYDGAYVYTVHMGEGAIVSRVDIVAGTATEIMPGGEWAGATQGWYADDVWIFGETIEGNVVLGTDYGNTLTALDDAAWDADELVRPFFIDWYDPKRLVAYLSNGLEVYQSTDEGETWAQVNAAAPFDAQSGAMDWINPENIFVGRTAAGADPVQFSPNSGTEFAARSTGIVPPNAVITALVITA